MVKFLKQILMEFINYTLTEFLVNTIVEILVEFMVKFLVAYLMKYLLNFLKEGEWLGYFELIPAVFPEDLKTILAFWSSRRFQGVRGLHEGF